jgi:hypothetical protein
VPQEGRIEAIFEASFFHISLFVIVLILRELLRPAGDEFGETEGGFCPYTCPYPINSFSFFPGVSVEEKQTSVQTPFFAEIRVRLSWQAVPDFGGFVAILGRGG